MCLQGTRDTTQIFNLLCFFHIISSIWKSVMPGILAQNASPLLRLHSAHKCMHRDFSTSSKDFTGSKMPNNSWKFHVSLSSYPAPLLLNWNHNPIPNIPKCILINTWHLMTTLSQKSSFSSSVVIFAIGFLVISFLTINVTASFSQYQKHSTVLWDPYLGHPLYLYFMGKENN